jgi:uncharacterized metal-binding protein
MKEWIYRRGEEYKVVDDTPFWKKLLFVWLPYSYIAPHREDIKHFIDLINSEGKVRRLYIK